MAEDEILNSTPSSDLAHTVYDGLTIELVPAPFWRRFLALSVDYGLISVILYIAFIVLALLFAFVAGGLAATSNLFSGTLKDWVNSSGALVGVIIGLLLLLALMSLYHLYFIYYESKSGSTPGKKLFGIQVVNLKGGRLHTGQCVSREIFRYVDVFLFLPGLISWSVTARRQRLGDLFAGTMVTWSESAEKSANFLYLTQESFYYLQELLKPRELSEPEAQRVLQVAYPMFVLGRSDVLSTLDLKVWGEFANTIFAGPAPAEINDEAKLRFIAELSFQKYGNH